MFLLAISGVLWSEAIYADNQPIHYCADTGVGCLFAGSTSVMYGENRDACL